MLALELKGMPGLLRKLEKMPPEFLSGFKKTFLKSGHIIKAQAQNNLSGPILNPQTGHLRASVQVRLVEEPNAISVFVGTKVRYGAAQETGATILNGFGKGILINLKPKRWLARSSEQSKPQILNLLHGDFARLVDKAERK